MRLSTLFLLFSFSLVAGCGSSTEEPTTSEPLELGEITQGPVNEIELTPGEFYRPNAFVDDAANNRWLVADKVQGIIEIDKATTAVPTVLVPLATDDTGIQSVSDLALDPATNTLYVLDTAASNIAAIDTISLNISHPIDSEDLDGLGDARWGAPTSLFFDTANNRLLVGDPLGLLTETLEGVATNAFCIFILTPSTNAISIMAEADSRAFPRFGIFDIHYDAINERIIALTLQLSDAGILNHSVQTISEDDWSNEGYFFNPSDSEDTLHNALLASITYNSANDYAYAIDRNSKAVYGFNLALTGEDENGDIIQPEATSVTNTNDDGAYPFQLLQSAALNFSPEHGLLLLDETTRALLSFNHDEAKLETDSASRSLIFSGIPLSENPDTFLQFPYDLMIDPNTEDLIITDRTDAQRNAIVSSTSGNSYTPWVFNIDVEALTPIDIDKTTDVVEGEEQEIPEAPSITKPKPILLSKNAQGDTFIYALGFSRATDDDFLHHSYLPGIYQRLGSEGNDAVFKPISTIDVTRDNGDIETVLQDFSVIFTPSELRNFAVVESGIIFNYERTGTSSTISYLIFWNKTNNTLTSITDSSGAYSPRNVTGFALSADESTLYVADAYHDSIIAITLQSLDSTPSFSFAAVSGRPHDGEYIALPAGLVLNKEGTTAWVFDNRIRAVIQINLDTGLRTRLHTPDADADDSPPKYSNAVKTLVLSEDESTLYAIDKILNRVISIDIVSGNQAWGSPLDAQLN